MGNELLQWEKCGDGLLQNNILSRYTASFAVVSNVKDKLRQWILLSYRRTSVLQWPIFLLVYFLKSLGQLSLTV
jgi:hypothetical protein